MDILYPPISCLHNKLTLVLGQPLERIPCGPFISKAPVPHETHLSPDHPCPRSLRKYPTYATCNHPFSPLGLWFGLPKGTLLFRRSRYIFRRLLPAKCAQQRTEQKANLAIPELVLARSINIDGPMDVRKHLSGILVLFIFIKYQRMPFPNHKMERR